MDDTDGPNGGCTTFTLTEVVRAANDRGIDLLGEPRLVRLNPNIPWKTRGNAALAARFGRGRGVPRIQGAIGRHPIRSFPNGSSPSPQERLELVEEAWQAVERTSSRGVPGTDPALVASTRRLPGTLYREAVRQVVPVAHVEALLSAHGAAVRTADSRRGIVGAASALSWPARRATWELIAYRSPSRIGTPRRVDGSSVIVAERRHPAIFLCHDPRTRRLLVAPHTDCPILYGIRSTDADTLRLVRQEIRSEPVERWMIFRTNQGTGDHLHPTSIAELTPYSAGILEGHLATNPESLPGGHARFLVRDVSGATVECLAFEPTKTLPPVARSLQSGDRVRVWGGRGRDRSFRLEGIELVRLVPRWARPAKPICPECGRRSESAGRLRGFRCRRCRRSWAPEEVRRVRLAPPYPVGRYHPTPSARRHLAPRARESQRPSKS